MNLVYYITGHGYGHAVRSIEVIKELLSEHSDIHVFIRTGAPEWLFAEVRGPRTTFYKRHIEIGVIQQNSYSVDKKATLAAVAELLDNKQEIVSQEVTFLKEKNIKLVVSDHTPFAFDAANKAGIPTIGAANFSWDWIYADYIKELPEFEYVIKNIKKSYRLGKKLYRLPYYGDMPFKQIIDVPLVGRKSKTHPNKTREKMGLSSVTEKLVLLALKEQDLAGVNWSAVGRIKNYRFLVLSTSISQKNIINYNEGLVPFQDIVSACDAVISKPGYSVVAEILINQTPILYVPREDFVEDFALRKGLVELAVCQEISLQQFNSGLWESHLDLLFNSNKTWAAIETDGAKVLARKILDDLNKLIKGHPLYG